MKNGRSGSTFLFDRIPCRLITVVTAGIQV